MSTTTTTTTSETPRVKREDTRPRESLFARLDALVFGIVTSAVTLYLSGATEYVRTFEWGPRGTTLLFEYPLSAPTLAVVGYLLMVHVGGPLVKRFRAKQAESDAALWVFPLKAWNLGLAWASLAMLLGMLYYYSIAVFASLAKSGAPITVVAVVRAWVLDNELVGWHGEGLFWLYLFFNCKYFELFDTFLLVVRQKPVSFLHWYHHTTVLLFSWLALWTRFAPGYTFGIVNAAVHTIMYWYYYRSACGIKLTYDKFITTVQIVQMALGLLVCATWTFFWLTATPSTPVRADKAELVIASASVMYASYFYLFYSFFTARYSAKSAAAAASKKVE